MLKPAAITARAHSSTRKRAALIEKDVFIMDPSLTSRQGQGQTVELTLSAGLLQPAIERAIRWFSGSAHTRRNDVLPRPRCLSPLGGTLGLMVPGSLRRYARRKKACL